MLVVLITMHWNHLVTIHVVFCVQFNILSFSSAQLFCSDLLKPNKTIFYPMRHCQRSNKTRIAAKNVDSLQKCAQYAENNQGLAFNFGHGQRPRKMSDDKNLINLFDTLKENNETHKYKIKKELENSVEPYFNCEVLDCPEVGNMSTILNDTRYDYYTLYGKAPANATCLPTIGLFMFFYEDRRNYSLADETCRNHSGFLANVMSYERTNYLSSLVWQHATDINNNAIVFQSTSESEVSPTNIPIYHAFIGLRERQRKSKFFDSTDIPIDCYLFRAWEPKYPNEEKRFGCVAVTNTRSWKMFDCRKRMPFICELKPSRPRRNKKFNQRCSLRRSNN